MQRVVCPLCSRPAARRLPADSACFECPSCGCSFAVASPIASAASRRRRYSRGRTGYRQTAISMMVTLVLVTGLVMFCMLGWLLGGGRHV